MRVLHLYNRFDHIAGGIVAALEGLTRAQVRAGIDVSLVVTACAGEDTSLCDRLVEQGVDVTIVGPCTTALRLHPDLRPTIEKKMVGADVVHIHAVWEEIQHAGAQIAYRANVPYLVSPHGMLDPYTLQSSRLRKWLYLKWRLQKNLNRAAAVHCTTPTEAQLAGPLLKKTEPFVEGLGVDLREFATLPEAGLFRRRIGLEDGRKLLLFLSRVQAKKGLDILIPAFAGAEVEDTTLVIAGPNEGGYQAVIQKLIDAHGVGDRVIFPGMLFEGQRIEALVDADMFILPSYQENFGIVVVESLASGTPVLISDQVNLHAAVTEAQVGEVAPTEASRFADLIRRWMGDTALRQAAAERSRPYALEHYDWDVIARHWIDHYTRIAAQRR